MAHYQRTLKNIFSFFYLQIFYCQKFCLYFIKDHCGDITGKSQRVKYQFFIG
jgi:hypothetical protein